jgi:hypothetical protein
MDQERIFQDQSAERVVSQHGRHILPGSKRWQRLDFQARKWQDGVFFQAVQEIGSLGLNFERSVRVPRVRFKESRIVFRRNDIVIQLHRNDHLHQRFGHLGDGNFLSKKEMSALWKLD